jgi:hypothetical protein
MPERPRLRARHTIFVQSPDHAAITADVEMKNTATGRNKSIDAVASSKQI